MMLEKNILVTIGISFFKDKDTLSYAIRSVQKQTWKNFELILVDDGGNDGSLDIAKEFLNDKRIRLVSDGQNKGLPTRLNELIDLAKGKYFARMDADDIMHPLRIKRQVEYLELHHNIDVLGTGAYSLSINGEVLGRKRRKINAFSTLDVFKRTPVMHPTVMAKIEWYRNNKYSTESYAIRAEDYELWIRSFSNTKFYNLEDELLFYREGNSIHKEIDSQIKTYQSSIKIIKKYATDILGKKEIIKLILVRIFKIYVYKFVAVFSCAKIVDIILKNRYTCIPLKEKECAEKILIDILKI